jgi:hypothetical protein
VCILDGDVIVLLQRRPDVLERMREAFMLRR